MRNENDEFCKILIGINGQFKLDMRILTIFDSSNQNSQKFAL